MSAFGEGDPDRYDPYAGYAGGGFQDGGFPGGAFDGGVEPHTPRHRHGSRMLVAAVIGTIALIVVGAVAFAGSLVMSRTSSHAPQSNVAGAASAEPGDLFGGASGDPSAAGSDDPVEKATASPAPTPTTRATSAAPTKQTTPPAKPKTSAAAQGGNAAYEAQVLTIVNSERAKAGCQPLAYNAKLRAAAYKHSADMAARNYFSHDTPEGVSFATRITNEGYRWSNAAENIAKGQRTPEDVMNAWMNSSGHRANILNCKLKDLGVGLAYQGKTPIWTQDFGTQM
ncbi:CAP domain-containing protein [Dactylosporangium sp. NPDC048998]|uniref:CAP domain-containing protein n=1 Tax=Dactylosporangium sp. NPDC048998 TaxID=3363976 RepID=UPI0037149EE7